MSTDRAFEHLRSYTENGEDPLRVAAELRAAAEELVTARVVQARLDGSTWERIGDHLGVTRQAVMKKYRSAVERFGQLPLEP